MYKIIIDEVTPNQDKDGYNNTISREVLDISITDEEYLLIRPLLFRALSDKSTS